MARPRNTWEIAEWVVRIAAQVVRVLLELARLPR